MHWTHGHAHALQDTFPGTQCPITSTKTVGDVKLGQSLAVLAAATPGLFTKELEVALANAECDLVVHSLKDVPTTLPAGLAIVCIPQREDPTDSLVLAQRHQSLEATASSSGFVSLLNALPAGAVVGTSSIRRAALLRRLAPHLTIEDVRGNLNSRIAKLDKTEEEHRASGTQHYDALVLATAGLVRLGWQDRISETFDTKHFGYGVSQGALGIEMRTDLKSPEQVRLLSMLKSIQHAPTAARCAAERGLLRALRGGCQVPLAVTSHIEETASGLSLALTASVLSLDGSQLVHGSLERKLDLVDSTASSDLPAELIETGFMVVPSSADNGDSAYISQALSAGAALAEQLLQNGAAQLLPGFDDSERPATYGSPELAGVADRS